MDNRVKICALREQVFIELTSVKSGPSYGRKVIIRMADVTRMVDCGDHTAIMFRADEVPNAQVRESLDEISRAVFS